MPNPIGGASAVAWITTLFDQEPQTDAFGGIAPAPARADAEPAATPINGRPMFGPEPVRFAPIRSDAQLRELARMPADAPAAWKRLDSGQRAAVVLEMSRLYGQPFAKAFLKAAETGTRDLGSQHYGPGFPEHTPNWFEDRGYKLARRDLLNEWWVHPTGRLVTQDRGLPWMPSGNGGSRPTRTPPTPTPPTVPPRDCDATAAAEVLKMTLEWVQGDVVETEGRMKEIEEAKLQLDRTPDVTSKAFADAYDGYVGLLADAKHRVQQQLDSLSGARADIEAMCGNTKALDQARDRLEELQLGFGVMRELLDMEGRKPIKVDVLDIEP